MRNFRFYSFIPSLLTVLSLSVTVRASAISTDSTKDVPAKETKRYIVSLADDASPDNFCARRGFRMRKQERNSPNGFARKLASDEALILPGFNMVICSMSSEEAKAARPVIFISTSMPSSDTVTSSNPLQNSLRSRGRISRLFRQQFCHGYFPDGYEHGQVSAFVE